MKHFFVVLLTFVVLQYINGQVGDSENADGGNEVWNNDTQTWYNENATLSHGVNETESDNDDGLVGNLVGGVVSFLDRLLRR
ncbi:hypothetical protein HA402_015197 [Bradysia odoriphaga]|nr:hypothetical protein HA402_015197 [Bradysia odoriphaga]